MAVYKQYYNAYEKKAEEIRRAAKAIENGIESKTPTSISTHKEACVPSGVPVEKEHALRLFDKFAFDDLLLLALIFLLLTSEKKDTLMLFVLGYLLICE